MQDIDLKQILGGILTEGLTQQAGWAGEVDTDDLAAFILERLAALSSPLSSLTLEGENK